MGREFSGSGFCRNACFYLPKQIYLSVKLACKSCPCATKIGEMKIERLAGTDSRLYERVAPLVMNPEVLKQNNNYPFKTSDGYVWFVALDDEGKVRGFMPVEIRKDNVVINNYYVEGDDADVLGGLIDSVWKEFGENYAVRAVVHLRHAGVFAKKRFDVTKEWTLYKKMQKTHGNKEKAKRV